MQHALLIAEKPDLMRKIQAVYNKHKSDIPYSVEFLSQRGHLVTLKNPSELDEELSKWSWDTLPIEPENYGGWRYKVIKEPKTGKFMTAQERFTEIHGAVASGKYDFIIHAGDPDQEGELLVNIVLRSISNKLPVKRFWTNDLTESHILNALKNLKDDDKDPMLTNLMSAAYARQHSDWRFGMNISRAATLKMDTAVSCGRVKTPILGIVCKREEEIRNFKPSTCYGVKAIYKEGFDGTLFNKSTEQQEDEEETDDKKSGIIWFETKKEAEDLVASLDKEAKVIEYQTKRTETTAPKLFKLATLQIEAGKKGHDDAATLDAVQKLYESEYVSYPRTDCEYLSSGEDFDGILEAIGQVSNFDQYTESIKEQDIQRVRKSRKWINDKALQDAGHSALRPTTKTPDLNVLSDIEKDVYDLICRRFIAMFLPPLIQDKVALVTQTGDSTFKSNGTTLVDPGYTVIFNTKFTDIEIPEHNEGDVLDVEEYQITDKTTTCPKRYTSPDLIAICENPAKFLDDKELKKLGKKLKIGTPATRSSIIRELIEKNKYLVEQKEKKSKVLAPSELGEAIIKNLDGLQICRVDMTGYWEEQLEQVRNGELTLKAVEADMRASVREMVEEIKNREMKKLSVRGDRKVVGTCPICGKDVIESDKGFYCSGFKDGCKISIFKTAYGLDFTFEDFEKLAKKEKIEKTGGRKFYFNFDTSRLMEETAKTNIPCPSCPASLEESPIRYSCPSCGLSFPKVVAKHELTRDEIKVMGENGMTDVIDDFVSKKGTTFSARLEIVDKGLTFKFETAPAKETGIKCPCCKKGMITEHEKYFGCDCGFKIWKNIAQRTITKEEVKQISEDGKTKLLDGFTSKKSGKNFSCRLVLNKRKKTLEMEDFA